MKIPEYLSDYNCKLTRRDDFFDFWSNAINNSKKNGLNPKKELIKTPLNSILSYKISYTGYDQTPVSGYMLLPNNKKGKLPVIIHFHGFNGNKGYPNDYLQFTDMGYAVLAIDIRGQGGETYDFSEYNSGYNYNVTVKGILNKDEYYLKKIYIDCIKAIDFSLTWEEIDPNLIIVNGGSQGGALSLAVAAFDKRPKYCFSDVPSNCNIEKRILDEAGSFSGISDYLKKHPFDYKKVMETVSYFDLMNIAENIECEIFSSVGLKDKVCPAICYFAAYNRINSKKEVHIYPLNGHEGGGSHHNYKKLFKLKEILNAYQNI